MVRRVENAGRRLRASAVAALVGAAVMAIGASGCEDRLIYNPSASMPVGFYVRIDRAPQLGDIVSVRARDVAPHYAALRGFDDTSDRFIKRLVARDGDEICAEGGSVRINGLEVARRARHDSEGRALPTWKGCVRLAGHYLLLGESDDSFDGRYWGPAPAATIEAVWRPVRQ